MDFVLETGTAAIGAQLLVALYKHARPNASSASVVLCAVLAGQLLSFLASVAQADAMTMQNAAVTVFAGIFAAATAAGVRSADNASDEKRNEVKQ